ncbi:Probable nuclear hormone receptor HR3 [Eumeta japonica]|uniref:Probable nuclear hormone receptor HR3 n=1 Tax=Eumeta variegata TaxID=151549 RepID=A0A4C1XQ31_EUMVA|nr:Probable nuclear hormone receptor HR3 [Eumeta japonica]
MDNNQFQELFGSQWPPDQHGHCSATNMHQGGDQVTPPLPQGMQLKREPHSEVQGMLCRPTLMGHDIQQSGNVADSTSPPPGSGDGVFGSSIPGMFMDKKAVNSIRDLESRPFCGELLKEPKEKTDVLQQKEKRRRRGIHRSNSRHDRGATVDFSMNVQNDFHYGNKLPDTSRVFTDAHAVNDKRIGEQLNLLRFKAMPDAIDALHSV